MLSDDPSIIIFFDTTIRLNNLRIMSKYFDILVAGLYWGLMHFDIWCVQCLAIIGS